MEVFQSTYFWLSISLLIFIFIAYKPIKSSIITMLDSKILSVKNELDHFLKMRNDAEEEFLNYKSMQEKIQTEINETLNSCDREIERLKSNAKDELEEYVSRREAQIEDKIKSFEDRVLRELRFESVDMAVEVVRSLVKENITDKISNQVLEDTVGLLSKKIH